MSHSFNRAARRKNLKNNNVTYVRTLVKEEMTKREGTINHKAQEKFNKALSMSTTWVVAALVKAIDEQFHWKHGSKRYWKMLQEFNKQYNDLLRTEDKTAWVQEASDIANVDMNIRFEDF